MRCLLSLNELSSGLVIEMSGLVIGRLMIYVLRRYSSNIEFPCFCCSHCVCMFCALLQPLIGL